MVPDQCLHDYHDGAVYRSSRKLGKNPSCPGNVLGGTAKLQHLDINMNQSIISAVTGLQTSYTLYVRK